MCRRLSLGLLTAIGLIAANPLRAQTSASSESPLPATGLDFTAVDAFWHIRDILASGAEPSETQWQALLSTPGSRLAEIALGKVVREDLELAFKPANRTAFDSLSTLQNDRASRLRHLVRAASLRPQLTAFRDSLRRSAPVAEAIATAARFLPPGATQRGDPPLVAFAIFRDDGYSLGPGIIVDLLHAYEANLVLFLAHEFHHTYTVRAEQATNVPPNDQPSSRDEWMLRAAIQALRSEGIADLIDKPHPLTSTNPVRAAYVTRYNAEYEKTPATLHELDSLLAVVADDSTKITAVGQRARVLLWSNSHANGAYMARTIYEQFGIDSLFPAIADPVALFRTYTAAVQARGNPPPFSPGAWRILEAFENRYWRAAR